MNSTPQILDPCCGGKMLWFNKNDRRAAFCDRRREKHILCDGRFFEVNPDTVCDFRKLPFTDESFFLKEYADTIAMAEAMGGTGLEAQALPLDAKLVSSIELTPKKDGVDTESAFTETSNLQEFDVKVLGKPYTAKKVHELVAQGVVGHEGLSDALHADAESFDEKRAA